MRLECQECHNKTVNRLIRRFQPDEQQKALFFNEINTLFNKNYSNPYLAGRVHNFASKFFQCSDLYATEKKHANNVLISNYDYWKKFVSESTDPFYTAAKLAVAGNIIDYGAHCVPDDIEKQVLKLVNKPLKVDQGQLLKQRIKDAKSVLYLADNAGEIVFDKLFIETMKCPNIAVAVRGSAIINDATLEDVKQIGLDKTCRVISNGYSAPSTILEYCSAEFIEEFNKADLIISKGMGNYEGLMFSEKTNICFMLMAKCKPIGQLLNVNKGDQLIKFNN